MALRVSDEEFIRVWRQTGSPARLCEILGYANPSMIYKRRKYLEKKYGITLAAINDRTNRIEATDALPKQGIRRLANITGHVVVFSDAHFWPGKRSVAYHALVKIIADIKPAMIVANGDILDGARISRHGRIGWEQRPSLKDELDSCREAMDAIRAASRRSLCVWNLGNHDVRFSRYLAENAPEMEGVAGSELEDHIPYWQLGWSLLVNDSCMIKHRAAGGIHAVFNNTLKGGKSMVTGHLHRLLVTNWADYSGVRWGVDSGTLSEIGPEAGAFNYAEDDYKPWSSGFVVLTFLKDGRLIEPEVCRVIDGIAYFRGERV